MPTINDLERQFLTQTLGASALATDTIDDLRSKFYSGVVNGTIVLGGGGPAQVAGSTDMAYINPVSGAWYGARVPGISEAAGLNSGKAIGAVHFVPFSARANCTISNIAIGAHANGDAGITIRTALYNDDGNFWPGTLIAEVGTVPGNTVSPSKTWPGPWSILKDKVYWLVLGIQGVFTTAYPNIKASGTQVLTGSQAIGATSVSLDNVLNGADEWLYLPAATVAGAFPATFPARSVAQPISQAVNFGIQIQ